MPGIEAPIGGIRIRDAAPGDEHQIQQTVEVDVNATKKELLVQADGIHVGDGEALDLLGVLVDVNGSNGSMGALGLQVEGEVKGSELAAGRKRTGPAIGKASGRGRLAGSQVGREP